MNSKIASLVKNFSYAISSNLITLFISTIVILIVPKLIGVEDYGYWQLYIFYSAYVGVMHFGWLDGIYLRYGGLEYKSLNKELFFSQFYMFLIFQIFISSIVFFISILFIEDKNRMFIIEMLALNLLLMNVYTMLLFILQATSRIKEYAIITVFGKAIYLFLIILFMLVGIRDFKLLIAADIISKFLALTFIIYYCKEIVFNRITFFRINLQETILNIKSGIKLLFANIASNLIVGNVRFGIERNWGVETFGKVSLTLSISGMVMIFINAIGIVLFPILKRINTSKLPFIYISIKELLMAFLFGVLLLYFPLSKTLSLWLPQYADSLVYMIFLFPLVIYEGKTGLLLNTFLKTVRQEKVILWTNSISLIISMIFSFISIQLLDNLNLAILSILLVLIIRAIMAEFFLARLFKLKVLLNTIVEMAITTTFIMSNVYLEFTTALVIYSVFYFTYILVKRKKIILSIKNLWESK